MSDTSDTKINPFKDYDGDTFGTRGEYIDGMVYMSRMQKPPVMSNRMLDESAINSTMDSSQDAAKTETVVADEDAELALSETTAKVEPKRDKYEQKQRCAATLRNWSFHPENAKRMVSEGAIAALMSLARTDDVKTQSFCATALMNLANKKELRGQIIDQGAVRTVVELCNMNSYEISRDCCAALCDLSSMSGRESRMVEDGSVNALTQQYNESKEFASICSRALFNLTCVEFTYDRIEKVVKAFLSLASQAPSHTNVETTQICASALCNLSNIKSIRTHMVDENIIGVVDLIARGGDNSAKRICAVLLQNLASSRACRAEMVNKGVLKVLAALANEDEEQQHWCAVALNKLTFDKGSRYRIVEEGGIMNLATLSRSNRVVTKRLCANALTTLSSHDKCKELVVEKGTVPVLISLAKSPDPKTKQTCTLALCNLLSIQESAVEIMQQGAVSALVQLSNTESEQTRACCAAVLFNLSCTLATGVMVVAEGFVPAIVTLSKTGVTETRQRCAATLCNLASYEANRRRMVDQMVVPCLVQLLEDRDPQCIRFCTSALCSVSQAPANIAEIVKDKSYMAMMRNLIEIAQMLGDRNQESSTGAKEPTVDKYGRPLKPVGGPVISAATRLAKQQDKECLKACCSVLSNLTFHEPSRTSLSQLGLVDALILLSRLDDQVTRRRCALSFCNLSCEPLIRKLMVDKGVVPVLTELSHSYSEENQLDVSKAFCNLGCLDGAEPKIVEEGAVTALMMIAMVRAVSPITKQNCARALLNLLKEGTLVPMVEDGLVQAFTALAKLESEDTMLICATVFCVLTADPLGRTRVAAKQSTLIALFGLLRSDAEHTQILCGRAVNNLLLNPDSQEPTVRAGAVVAVKKLAELKTPESASLSSAAYFIMSVNRTSCGSIVAEDALSSLVSLVSLSHTYHRQAVLNSLRALCSLSWITEVRTKLVAVKVLPALVNLARQSPLQVPFVYFVCVVFCSCLIFVFSLQEEVRYSCARVLCTLSFEKQNQVAMVRAGVVPALCSLFDQEAEAEEHQEAEGSEDTGGENATKAKYSRRGATYSLIAIACHCMSWAQKEEARIVADDGVSLLCRLTDKVDHQTKLDIAIALCNLSQDSRLREQMIEQGSLKALIKLAEAYSPECHWRCAATVRNLALVQGPELQLKNRSAMVAGGVVQMLVNLANMQGGRQETLQMIASSLKSLSQPRPCRSRIVEDGAVPMLIRLSNLNCPDTKRCCAMAMSNLSSSSSEVEQGTVSALISMSLDDEDDEDSAVLNLGPVLDGVFCGPPPPLPIEDIEAPAMERYTSKCDIQRVVVVKESVGPATEALSPPELHSDTLETVPIPTLTVGGQIDDDSGPPVLKFPKMQVPEHGAFAKQSSRVSFDAGSSGPEEEDQEEEAEEDDEVKLPSPSERPKAAVEQGWMGPEEVRVTRRSASAKNLDGHLEH
jgi:hypothetical protein